MNINLDRLALTLFLFSVVLLAFVYGIAVHKYKIFPFAYLHDAFRMLENPRPHYLHPIRYKAIGVKVHDRASISPGVTLITSRWPETDWGPGLRLIDADGNKLHQWNVDPAALWPKSPYTDTMAGQMNTRNSNIHGSYLFTNGDVLFNVDYLGLFRLNACGQVVWKLPYRTHHSISRDDDGNFWVSGVKLVEAGSERASEFPGLIPRLFETTALKVSPDGQIIREISLLKALFDSRYKYLFWKYTPRQYDLTHMNDVEPLSSKMAERFPMFAPGDLLASFRDIHAIAVFNQSGKIKWLVSESFNQQHDPDFEDNGWITVFDNRRDFSDTGEYLGGSAISAINPSTGEVRILYPNSEQQFFYTAETGKHQRLENGNRLITESYPGRIFEVDSSGRTVWEWVQRPYNDELIAEVIEGTRYTIPAKVVAGWPCK